ncbi:hypothetical protein B0J12DRAFT_704187 [Macrophomina phaseolina]|uniref:Uncharacterized protein n=1 Tax=Macrophomina phaseolina TaxID=35725 RepID=A0ABQ8FW60_9PEZI|nr:hypothetical protein B0J12DRAFT_704187 [Macrophomina phaseolina]
MQDQSTLSSSLPHGDGTSNPTRSGNQLRCSGRRLVNRTIARLGSGGPATSRDPQSSVTTQQTHKASSSAQSDALPTKSTSAWSTKSKSSSSLSYRRLTAGTNETAPQGTDTGITAESPTPVRCVDILRGRVNSLQSPTQYNSGKVAGKMGSFHLVCDSSKSILSEPSTPPTEHITPLWRVSSRKAAPKPSPSNSVLPPPKNVLSYNWREPREHSSPSRSLQSGSSGSSSNSSSPRHERSARYINQDEFVEGLWVFVHPDRSVPTDKTEGWRNHPGVIVGKLKDDEVILFTATGWGELGRGDKYEKQNPVNRPLYDRSFLLVRQSTDRKGIEDNIGRSEVVNNIGVQIFRKETFVDLRGMRVARKRNCKKYFRQGTHGGACLDPVDVRRVKARACWLSTLEDLPWAASDNESLKTFAKHLADQEGIEVWQLLDRFRADPELAAFCGRPDLGQ